MNRLQIADWLLALLPENGEPVQLKDSDFLKLDAALPPAFRRMMEIPHSTDLRESRLYNARMTQLYALRDFNRRLRQAVTTTPSVPMGPPTSFQEAEQQGYVECKVIHAVFSNRFGNPSKLTKYLNDPDRKKLIRQYKPNENRRMICAADFLKVLFMEQETEERARSQVLGDAPPRRNKPGK